MRAGKLQLLKMMQEIQQQTRRTRQEKREVRSRGTSAATADCDNKAPRVGHDRRLDATAQKPAAKVEEAAPILGGEHVRSWEQVKCASGDIDTQGDGVHHARESG